MKIKKKYLQEAREKKTRGHYNTDVFPRRDPCP